MLLVMFQACDEAKDKPRSDKKVFSVKDAEWMIGEWCKVSVDGVAMEIWVKENDTVFKGKSFFVNGQDTTLSETITIKQEGSQVFLMPKVIGQNGEQEVRFTLTATADHCLVFENPQHDFPQQISYRQINKDSLCAEISGKENGKPQAIPFPMGRIRH